MIQDRDRPDIGSRPVPDPTLLTTQQLIREMGALRELLETRLNAMDTATELNKTATDKIPCMIKDAVKALENLQNEKFVSIDKQFLERDIRADKIALLGKEAIAAALQAAKELVGSKSENLTAANSKTEQNFTKQLDQIGDRVTDLKERLDQGEGTGVGRNEIQEQSRHTQGWVIPMIVVGLLTLISMGINLVNIIIHLNK